VPEDAAEPAADVEAAEEAERALAATLRLRAAVATMSEIGARLILKVRATAGMTGPACTRWRRSARRRRSRGSAGRERRRG
jgi:hypothetical protein